MILSFGEIFNANVVSRLVVSHCHQRRVMTRGMAANHEPGRMVTGAQRILNRCVRMHPRIQNKKTSLGNNNNEKTNRYACFRFVGQVYFARMNWLETHDCS